DGAGARAAPERFDGRRAARGSLRQRAAHHAAATADDGRRGPGGHVLGTGRGRELARAAKARKLPRPDASALEREDAQPRRVPGAEADRADDAAGTHVEPAIAVRVDELVPG